MPHLKSMVPVAASAFLLASPALAQETVRFDGRVMDQRGAPVVDASIDVDSTFWRSRTRRDGHFSLAVPVGQWMLRVRHVGFAPFVRPIVVQQGMRDSIVVVLADASHELRGIVIRDERTRPMVSTITTETVRQAPPLGEPDILRLLPMLPSISQPNDILGRVHLAGGASDEHGVTLDGHPLQAPYHVHSVIGAFNVAALERAEVMMHHLPSAIDGHLSGAVDLQTRNPTAKSSYEVVASVLSTSVTASVPSIAGVDVLASGRVTYLDKVLEHFTRGEGSSDDFSLPAYRDALLKLHREWSGGFSADLLGYQTEDHWTRTGPDLSPNALRWGENLVGLRASYHRGPWDVALRGSLDGAFVTSRKRRDRPTDTVSANIDFVDLDQRWGSFALEVRRLERRWQIAGGVDADVRREDQRWAGALAEDLFKSGVPPIYDVLARQTKLGAYAEATVGGGTWWTATVGSHVSFVEGRSFIAPRALIGAQLTSATRLQLALDRRHQFDAIAGEPQEGSVTQPVFLLREPRRVDALAATIAWRPAGRARGHQVSVEAAAYGRRFRDRLTRAVELENAPCATSSTRRCDDPIAWHRVPGSTIGASLSADLTMANGTVVQTSYTAERSREVVSGHARPTSWDAPQHLSIFSAVPVTNRWTLTSAAQAHSGNAVTPVAARIFVLEGPGRFGQRFLFGEPNSARLPSYLRIDLGVRYHWTGWNAKWALSLQALNVLSRTNAIEYDWRNYFACQVIAGCPGAVGGRGGLPFLPSLGVEARW